MLCSTVVVLGCQFLFGSWDVDVPVEKRLVKQGLDRREDLRR